MKNDNLRDEVFTRERVMQVLERNTGGDCVTLQMD